MLIEIKEPLVNNNTYTQNISFGRTRIYYFIILQLLIQLMSYE